MDKYTKFILTVIAVGILSLNIQLFKDDIITNANAEVAGMDYWDLRSDYDFKKAVRRVVERYCTVSSYGIDC
ncbi:hypothetical protein OAR82_00080 [Candidatus Pelagibacter sp.]|nr:hypothetical protein [Candidatus Pelagibacter sp.]